MKTTVFMNNRTQAVRIPKDLAFPPNVTNLEITREGDVITLRPLYKDLSEWLENGGRLSEDFIREPWNGEWREIANAE